MKTTLVLSLFAAFLVTVPAAGKSVNGFDLSEALIPVKEILKGGPPRDGIPAINYPDFLDAHEAGYLQSDDRVIGVIVGGQARAYPIKVLNWHEIVNDVIGEQHFVVTYCPLCGTGMVFASNIAGKALVFGVSGLLYNSDVLLFDRQTESLWSQIMGKAVSGPLKQSELSQLPAFHTTWEDWFGRHPETQVLSLGTGANRDYNRNPYDGYERSKRLYFKVSSKSELPIHPKERVLGIEVNGIHKAYPFAELGKTGVVELTDRFGEQELTIHFDPGSESAHVTDASGSDYASTTAFWFAWYAFYPETLVYSAEEQP